MKIIATSFFVSLLFVVQTVSATDLLQVFSLSLKSDPQLLAEAASQQAVNEQEVQAQANFLPEIALSANNGRVWSDSSATTFGGKRDYNSHGYSLSLTQPLYRRSNFIQQTQADIAIEGAQASYLVAEQALIVRVAEGYFNVLGSQDDLSFAVAEQEAIALQLEQTERRFDVGVATITDKAESQAAYDSAYANVIEAENALKNSQEQLREITGEYLTELALLKAETPLVSPEPMDIDEWSTAALNQNPALSSIRSNVETARQQIELEKSGHYPTVDLVAQKTYSSQSDSSFGGSSKNHQEVLNLQFALPLYSGGRVTSKTHQAEYLLQQSMQLEEQKRREVTRQTREAFNSVISGISRVKALKQAVMSNQQAFESTQAGYEVGTRTTVDVLNARRELFSAKRDYSRVRYNYILDTLRLKQAAGMIGVNDLENINQWLEG
jgi:outer membrane protein